MSTPLERILLEANSIHWSELLFRLRKTEDRYLRCSACMAHLFTFAASRAVGGPTSERRPLALAVGFIALLLRRILTSAGRCHDLRRYHVSFAGLNKADSTQRTFPNISISYRNVVMRKVLCYVNRTLTDRGLTSGTAPLIRIVQ